MGNVRKLEVTWPPRDNYLINSDIYADSLQTSAIFSACHNGENIPYCWLQNHIFAGGEFSISDSLLTHALVGIPGINGTPWITMMSKNILIKCS